tara:strand:- start:1564 stop:2358 length:795 start_codon:yes stop_codon:yes gene_type:complete
MNTLAKIEYPQFKADDGAFTYGFFGKNGGVSPQPYNTLNVSFQSGDAEANIRENRRRIASQMQRDLMDIYTVKQVHGRDCLVVSDEYDSADEAPDADALVTDKPNMPIAVMTADCVPVLFSARKQNGAPVIGAAHAGWGGALKGIIESTLSAMQHLEADLTSVQACIGPCIQKKSYEVSIDFATPFLEQDEAAERLFSEGQHDDKLLFDLPAYVMARLAKAGVRQVFDTGLDTYARAEDFFSYRRATHEGLNDYGRQASVIMIR